MTHASPATPWRQDRPTPRWALLGVAVAVLCACQPSDRQASTPAAAPAVAAAPPLAPVSYTPPTADVLYQMVAPIALYPDKLVALVLAGAVHPDEVSSAYNWLAQNPSVQADAVNLQPWDPSIKALTTFPNALNLLQANLPWTTALGLAYNNDPADVLNAIQVMRHRASKAGKLASNTHLRVTRASVSPNYTPDAAAVAAYSGPVAVPPPDDYIAIEPAQAQTVYVPSYDPRLVYGEPVAYYSGYRYQPPSVQTVDPLVVGALAFGAGVLISGALDHHDWGWHNWGVHWGDGPAQSRWHRGEPPLPPMARPIVTYRQSSYVSHVSTVVNNTRVDNHNVYHAEPPRAPALAGAAGPAANPQAPPATQHHEAAIAGAALAGTAAAGALAAQHMTRPPRQGAPVPPHTASIAQGPSPVNAPHMERRGAVPPAAAVPPVAHVPPPREAGNRAPVGRPRDDARHVPAVAAARQESPAAVQRPELLRPAPAVRRAAPTEPVRPVAAPQIQAAAPRQPTPAPHAAPPAAPVPHPIVRTLPTPMAAPVQREAAPRREPQQRPEPPVARSQDHPRAAQPAHEKKDERKER